MTTKLLIVGYGAIAQFTARALENDPGVDLSAVLARPGREEHARSLFADGTAIAASIDKLEVKPDLALECAGHAGLQSHGAAILRAGIPLGVLSIGALGDEGLLHALREAARGGGTQMHILSGAIGAVDALSAARQGGLESVVYSGIKPAKAWTGTPAEELCDLSALHEPMAFFEGGARDAALRFPKNANVAATVALAGIGFDETKVRLVADPGAAGNTHHIEAKGAFGTFEFTICGAPLPDNPKSSAMTAMSALRFVRNQSGAMTI